jgi:hypothetical protein
MPSKPVGMPPRSTSPKSIKRQPPDPYEPGGQRNERWTQGEATRTTYHSLKSTKAKSGGKAFTHEISLDHHGWNFTLGDHDHDRTQGQGLSFYCF